MRVLWLTPGFAAHAHDYTCIPPMQLLAQELLRQGVDLQIVALEYPFHSKPYRWSIEGAKEATVFPCNGQNRRWLKPRTLWRAMRFCHEILDEQAAVIHSFWLGWASGVGEKVSRRRGTPHITTLMGQDVLPKNRKFQGGLSLERAAHLVAVSDFQNDLFEKSTGFRAAHVVPWGIAQPTASASSQRTLDVLGVGSLIPVKNWEKWLNTIALIAQAIPTLQAELIGDGPERATLERLTEQLGLQNHVRFAGNLLRPAVLDRMRQASVLLHTAHFESFGYVMAEAVGCGCQVVSTPVGAARALGATAEQEVDLAGLVLKALRQPVQIQPVVPYLMRQTAADYIGLYGRYSQV